jgi:glycosyltransferase involved in cell wall biosynthesis
MNVLFVHQSAELYGSDRVLLALVDFLQRTADVHPIVVLPEAGPLRDELAALGVEVHVRRLAKVQRSAFTPAGLLKLLRQTALALGELDSAVAGRRIAAVHSNTIAVLSGALWARVRGVRHVWHIHEIILKPRPVAVALAWLVHLMSDRVACISQMVRDNLVEQCPRIAERCTVVANGIVCPSRDIATARVGWRQQRGLKSGDVVVGLVGRINAWKGQGLLVDAVRRIVAADPTAALRVVIVGSVPPGQDELLTRLQAQIAGAGLQRHVEIIGFTPDVWPIWCGMDIAIVPSTDPEPFGMVALEAMCAARPVVASAHGGLVDIVLHGETGYLFEPGNADELARCITTLAASGELRTRLGSQGRERACLAFGLATQAAAFRSLYVPV